MCRRGWVEGEWAESADTVEGRGVHRRVDRGAGAASRRPKPGHARALHP
jgi:hypothetical protein